MNVEDSDKVVKALNRLADAQEKLVRQNDELRGNLVCLNQQIANVVFALSGLRDPLENCKGWLQEIAAQVEKIHTPTDK